jgi:hypothetical protein
MIANRKSTTTIAPITPREQWALDLMRAMQGLMDVAICRASHALGEPPHLRQQAIREAASRPVQMDRGVGRQMAPQRKAVR